MAPATKRRKLDQPEAITFDPEARQEYLTGFHKRKKARIQHAKDVAVKRDKEDRVKARHQLRQQRKEDLEKHIADVNAELRKQNPDLASEEDDVDEDEIEERVDSVAVVAQDVGQEEDYVDEDKYTTVTVEAMDGAEDEDATATKVIPGREANGEHDPAKKKKPWSKDATKARTKKKKFRYESKAERQATRKKQKTKSHAQKARREGK